jgi:hypothetical protein
MKFYSGILLLCLCEFLYSIKIMLIINIICELRCAKIFAPARVVLRGCPKLDGLTKNQETSAPLFDGSYIPLKILSVRNIHQPVATRGQLSSKIRIPILNLSDCYEPRKRLLVI